MWQPWDGTRVWCIPRANETIEITKWWAMEHRNPRCVGFPDINVNGRKLRRGHVVVVGLQIWVPEYDEACGEQEGRCRALARRLAWMAGCLVWRRLVRSLVDEQIVKQLKHRCESLYNQGFCLFGRAALVSGRTLRGRGRPDQLLSIYWAWGSRLSWPVPEREAAGLEAAVGPSKILGTAAGRSRAAGACLTKRKTSTGTVGASFPAKRNRANRAAAA